MWGEMWMEKSNVIISIIIVVCIAAAVAAYGLTNSDNAIFSKLGGVDSGNGGDGLNSTNISGINGSTGTSGSGSGSGSSSGSGVGSGSGRGSGGSGSGSGSGGSGSGSGSGGSGSGITSDDAKRIVNNHISQPGCYAGEPTRTSVGYNVPILNSNGNNVGYMLVSFSGKIIEGGGGAP